MSVHLEPLKAQREALEPHMQQEGGCRHQMFLGDCPECERYWALDDQISAVERGETETATP